MTPLYKKSVLDNGLRIISHHMPGRHSVSLGIWIKVGGRYENESNKGVAHFLEHLLFKGTKNYSCRKLKESIEGVGGSFNGFTSEELTCYLVKMPGAYMKRALNILSDMVINPALPEAEIKKERAVILEELKMYRDLPQSYVYELLDELLWPKHPLGSPIIGTVDSVSSMVKKDLVKFKDEFYTASNMVISAAGDIDEERLKDAALKVFSRFPRKKENSFITVRQKQQGKGLKVFDKDTEQTHMALGFRSFKREHPLRHALSLLHIILGANMSSRLFNEIREKRGLAYEIGTAVKRFHDTGAFLVHAGIDNDKVDNAIPLILKELSRIKKELVAKGEFDRAKEFYMGQLKLGLEDTMEHMLWIGESTAALNRAYSLDEIISEVQRVTRKDVCEAAKEVFKEENLQLSLIGPLKGSEHRIEKLLSLS